MTSHRPSSTARAIASASLAVAVSLTVSLRPASAQEVDEPIMDQVRAMITHEGFTVGMLLQAVVDPSIDGSDPDPASVQVAAMRLLASGSLDLGFDYLFQANLAASPSILDARVGWTLSEELGVWAGRFKAPFGRELLTSAGSIDFVNRYRASDALVPGRQMGVQLRGRSGVASWSIGGFTGPDNTPTNDALVGVARVEITPELQREDATLALALSVARGRDEAIGGGALGEGFDGEGSAIGLDARLTTGPFLLAGEAVFSDLDPVGTAEVDASGSHLTAGWMSSERTQWLLRWDRYTPVGLGADNTLVLGFNSWPTSATEIQVNWVAPVAGSSSPHEILVNFQIGF